MEADEPVIKAVAASAEAVLGRPAGLAGDIAWGDSGLLVEAGHTLCHLRSHRPRRAHRRGVGRPRLGRRDRGGA